MDIEDEHDSAAKMCNEVFLYRSPTQSAAESVPPIVQPSARVGWQRFPGNMEAVMASDPIRILIVDDDEDVLIALERLLEGEGYTTATAWSGKEALVLSKESK